MIRSNIDLYPSGLYRCCVYEFWNWVDQNKQAEVENGFVLKCPHCRSEMIVKNGWARWNKTVIADNGRAE